MNSVQYQPLFVPFGRGGPTPESVASANNGRAEADYVVSSADAAEGPFFLVQHPAFEEFMDHYGPVVAEPRWSAVDDRSIAGFHGISLHGPASSNPAGLSFALFNEMWLGPDRDAEIVRRFLDERDAVGDLSPRRLWPGIDECIPGGKYFGRSMLHILTMAHTVQRDVYDILTQGKVPLVIGGDHSINLGVMAGVALYARDHPDFILSDAGMKGLLDLLWVDAHADIHTLASSHTHNVHGMPVSALLGLGPQGLGAQILAGLGGIAPKISVSNLVTQIGLRDVEEAEAALLDSFNIDWYSNVDILDRRTGLHVGDIAGRQVMKNQHGRTVFSLDLDGLDPEDAPSVTTNVGHGLRLHHALEAIQVLRMLGGNRRFAAVEIHEFNPIRRLPDGSSGLTREQNDRTVQTILALMEALVSAEK